MILMEIVITVEAWEASLRAESEILFALKAHLLAVRDTLLGTRIHLIESSNDLAMNYSYILLAKLGHLGPSFTQGK